MTMEIKVKEICDESLSAVLAKNPDKVSGSICFTAYPEYIAKVCKKYKNDVSLAQYCGDHLKDSVDNLTQSLSDKEMDRYHDVFQSVRTWDNPNDFEEMKMYMGMFVLFYCAVFHVQDYLNNEYDPSSHAVNNRSGLFSKLKSLLK